jgi:hypothetical protein
MLEIHAIGDNNDDNDDDDDDVVVVVVVVVRGLEEAVEIRPLRRLIVA